MRLQILFYAFSAAAMLLLPAWLSAPPEQISPEPAAEAETEAAPAPAVRSAGSYRVLDTDSGTVTEISVRDYLIGAVGAEMPAAYEPEALKAQVVASHTYAERIRRMNAAAPDPSLCGADFSDDSSVYQAFFTTDELKAFYGSAFEENYARLAAAVDAAGDRLLCCDGEPIVAAFHAVSAGKSESAEAVWGTALPYLVSVSSDADRAAPQFEETVTLPPESVRRALGLAETDLPADAAQWFSDAVTAEAGTVLTIHCGSKTLTGNQLREALALRSACFTVSFDGSSFRFVTKGHGHGVGMSQFGANAMAAQGSSYQEILAHYYPGTVLEPAE